LGEITEEEFFFGVGELFDELEFHRPREFQDMSSEVKAG
jgi:hypothetical protein